MTSSPKEVLVIPEHKAVLLRHPAVHSLFPDAPKTTHRGCSYVVLPHKPAETTILRRLGHKVPPPVLSYYDFPSPAGEPPFSIQRFSTGELTSSPAFYNLSKLGT